MGRQCRAGRSQATHSLAFPLQPCSMYGLQQAASERHVRWAGIRRQRARFSPVALAAQSILSVCTAVSA